MSLAQPVISRPVVPGLHLSRHERMGSRATRRGTRTLRSVALPPEGGSHTLSLHARVRARTSIVNENTRGSPERSQKRLRPQARPGGHRRDAAGRARSEVENRKRLHRAKSNLEAPPGFEPGMEVLQTSALPLGDGADRKH